MAFDLSKIASALHIDQLRKEGRSVLGIDIGSSAIKLVQVKLVDDVPTLETYGELQLGPYGGVEIGRTTNLTIAKATEALTDIIRESEATAQITGMPTPYTSSFITAITLPTKDEAEIASRAPVEARKYIPVALNEVELDWFPVALKAASNETKLLLAATHKEGIKRVTTVAKSASLNLSVREIELFSTVRSVATQQDTVMAIIDMGAGSTRLYIVNEGMIARTHSIRMGGTEITNAIAKAKNIEFQAAEQLKRQYGLQDNTAHPDLGKIIRGILDRGFREMNHVMNKYATDEGVTFERVALAGGSSEMGGFTSYVQNELQKTVSAAEPFGKVAYPAFLQDTLLQAGPTFAVAVGIALRALVDEQ